VNQPPPYGPPPGSFPATPGRPPYYWPGPPPPPVSPAGVPLADFSQRLIAYIIDTALLTVVGTIFAIPVFLVFFNRVEDSGLFSVGAEPDGGQILRQFFLPLILVEIGYLVLLMAFYYLYAVEYMHRSGQTLGKKAMKIRVVPIDPSARLTRGMAAKRYLVEYIAGSIVPFFSYLDGLWQLWDKPYLQTLHDKAARTVVVKVSA
jgi:uncharacterized RDD family membrane protein YckC